MKDHIDPRRRCLSAPELYIAGITTISAMLVWENINYIMNKTFLIKATLTKRSAMGKKDNCNLVTSLTVMLYKEKISQIPDNTLD